jgi:hypothetical protein
VLVDPSPKLQSQDVGEPVEVSVNWTAPPVAGEVGLNVKDAARAATTVIALLALWEPELLVALIVTE